MFGSFGSSWCGDRLVVKFDRALDQDDPSRTNSVTVTLWPDGMITIDYSEVMSDDLLVGVFDGTHTDDRYLPVQSTYESYFDLGTGIILFDAFGAGPSHAGELTNRTIVFDPGG